MTLFRLVAIPSRSWKQSLDVRFIIDTMIYTLRTARQVCTKVVLSRDRERSTIDHLHEIWILPFNFFKYFGRKDRLSGLSSTYVEFDTHKSVGMGKLLEHKQNKLFILFVEEKYFVNREMKA